MGSQEGARVFLDNKDVVQEIDVDEEGFPYHLLPRSPFVPPRFRACLWQ